MFNKYEIGNAIKKARKEKGLTAILLSKNANVPQSSLSDWENGKTQPSADALFRICKALGTTPSALLNMDLNFNQDEFSPYKIPVIGTIRAGIPNTAIEDILDYEDITEEMARHGKHFGLKIKGNSMSPNLLENDVVIFRECEDADSGDVCAVLVNGDEATVKKIKKTEQGLFLIPYNTAEYEPVFFSHEDIIKKPVRIIGKAVEIRRTL